MECGVRSVVCVECRVWWSVACKVWSEECKVWSVECAVGKVWSVKCRVWRVELGLLQW